MNRQTIKQVLTEIINNYAVNEDIPLRYPNVEYEPELNQTWMEIFFLESASDYLTLTKGQQRFLGIMQIDISIPKNTGTYKSDSIIEDLKDIFEVGGVVRTTKGLVHIGNVYESGEDNSSSWYTKMLSIEYSEFNVNE